MYVYIYICIKHTRFWVNLIDLRANGRIKKALVWVDSGSVHVVRRQIRLNANKHPLRSTLLSWLLLCCQPSHWTFNVNYFDGVFTNTSILSIVPWGYFRSFNDQGIFFHSRGILGFFPCWNGFFAFSVRSFMFSGKMMTLLVPIKSGSCFW